MSYRRTTDFEEADYMSQPSRGRGAGGGGDQVRVMEREHDVYMTDQHRDRTPAFLREGGRRVEQGPMVLRRREVESFDRHRSSPSPPSPPPPRRIVEERLVRRARSESPPARERSRTRIVETERTVSPVRSRPRHHRSPSPTVRFVERVVRERSPTPPSSSSQEEGVVLDHEHIRIVERERGRSPPSPSPPPPVIKAPTIEREVITHYTDIDHGVIRMPQPSPPPPPPPPRRQRDEFRETDIDIHLDKHRTDVDIRRRQSRSRSRHRGYHDDHDLGLLYDSSSSDSDPRSSRLRVDVVPRRARSMVGRSSSAAVAEEGERIASRIDARGRVGEARGGATRRWETVDVPPGTERVRMDGAGGARTDTTWTRYSGERRTKFLPDGGSGASAASPAPILKNVPREGVGAATRERRLSVAVVDRDTEIDIEKRRRRRRSRSRPKTVAAPRDTWTEVSRSLVSREAMDRLGYPYQESKHYYYIMMFLPSDAVSELMNLSEEIRRARRRRANERSREIELDIEIDRDRDHHHHRPVQQRRRRRSSGPLDEHFRELEVSIDGRRPRGEYYY